MGKTTHSVSKHAQFVYRLTGQAVLTQLELFIVQVTRF